MILDTPHIGNSIDLAISDEIKSETQYSYSDSELIIFTNPIETRRPQLVDKILDLGYLANDWDGFGAICPSYSVIQNSLKFIKKLSDNLIDNLELDEVTPSNYGTIILEWEKENNYVSIEIGESEIGFFYEIDGVEHIGDSVKFNENFISREIIIAIQKIVFH